MKIALDIEGTIADIHHLFLNSYNKEKGANYTLEDIKWDFGGIEEVTLQEFFEYTKKQWKRNWKKVPPTEKGISKTLSRVTDLDTVKLDIVTGREGCEKEMKSWLKKEEIPYSNFVVEADKHKLNYDLYIDDNPDLPGKVKKLLLYRRPWNKKINSSESTKVIKKFDQVPKYLEL